MAAETNILSPSITNADASPVVANSTGQGAGSRLHAVDDIAPVSAQALHFITKSGDEVFATLVHHPGTKANPFPRRAYQGIREEVVGTLRDLLLENMRRNATRSESEDI